MKQLIANSLSKSINILIVDDDIEQLAEMVSWLEHRNGNLYQARSGEQATKVLQSQWIDAVITDWQLPEMSGLDLIRYLRSENFNGPLLLCTGMMLSPHHLQEAFDAGANDYLRKPMNEVELNARFASALQLHQQREALLQLNQSQQKFIDLLSQRTGDNLHHLHQMQRIDPNPPQEQALTHAMSTEFQRMMEWARYRFGLERVALQGFVLKPLVTGLAHRFPEHWHRVSMRGIKNIELYANPEILERILYELLDNAFKYSDGGVTIKVSQDAQVLNLSIFDQGSRISDGELERLKNPSYHGLGLSACSDLLSLLNSHLQTRRSRCGESVFFFELRNI